MSVDGFCQDLEALEGDRAVGIVVVLHRYLERPEVQFDFRLWHEVNAIEEDGIVADLYLRFGRLSDFSTLYVEPVLVEREAVEKLQKSAPEQIVLFLLGATHCLLQLDAVGLPVLVGGIAGLLVDGGLGTG